MKSFEQIARKLFETHNETYNKSFESNGRTLYLSTWDGVSQPVRDAWIAVAKAAYQEITEVH